MEFQNMDGKEKDTTRSGIVGRWGKYEKKSSHVEEKTWKVAEPMKHMTLSWFLVRFLGKAKWGMMVSPRNVHTYCQSSIIPELSDTLSMGMGRLKRMVCSNWRRIFLPQINWFSLDEGDFKINLVEKFQRNGIMRPSFRTWVSFTLRFCILLLYIYMKFIGSAKHFRWTRFLEKMAFVGWKTFPTVSS